LSYKKLALISISVGILVFGVFFVGLWLKNKDWKTLSPLAKLEEKEEKKEKPLAKYSFKRLKERGGKEGEIILDRVLQQAQDDFTSYLFFYESEGKKISGLANIPQGDGPFPVIVMLRGWVDPGMYQTGVGTQRAGEVFARRGYLTLAPDFLGYGESDMPPNDVWEERFIKNMNIMDLLASLCSSSGQAGLNIDPHKIGIWAHSNGGLSALTILELTGESYPTTLWAPVSQFFPYDVLYYTFEAEDKGKALRKSLAQLEGEYDADNYSFDNYLDWINEATPIQVHQGLADPYIPLNWSENLVKRLSDLGMEVNYFKYTGAGHNMEGSWDLVVQRDLEFFKEKL
jgi:dipeptidyl aminopeptidase/acylaminoacyl peptidase